jgi:hypothetical protein
MNYWLGVISTKATLEQFTNNAENYWFCFPAEATVGDKFAIYVTRKVSEKLNGIQGTYSITSLNSSCNDKCRTFGLFNGGSLVYAELELQSLFPEHIKLVDLKRNPILGRSQAVRRNFQGTIFKLIGSEFKEILMLGKQTKVLE